MYYYVCIIWYFFSIDDPLKKNATIGFINNFGQIPKQLFKKAHPSKKMSQRSSTILDPNNIIPSQGITPPEKLFFHNLENLRPSLQPVKGIYYTIHIFIFYSEISINTIIYLQKSKVQSARYFTQIKQSWPWNKTKC